MRPFSFRLERVREWKRKQCAAEEEKLRAAIGAATRKDEELAEARTESSALERDLASKAVFDAAELRGWAQYRFGARTRESLLMADRAHARAAAERQQIRWRAARLILEQIEKIRERDIAVYRTAAERETEEFAQESHLASRHRNQAE